MKLLSLLALGLISASAQAASVGSCEGLDSIGNLVDGPRYFANNEIRVAHVSTEEPAAAPDHLLVFVAEKEGIIMGSQCFAISQFEGLGFASLDLKGIKSSYDAKKGLLLSVPVYIYNPDTGGSDLQKNPVKVRINRTAENPKVTIEN